MSLLAILQRSSFLPDGLTPDPGRANSVNTSHAAQHPVPAHGEASPESPLLTGIMRIDGEAPEKIQPASPVPSQPAGSNGALSRPSGNGKPTGGKVMGDDGPSQASSGNGLVSSYSNGSGRASASQQSALATAAVVQTSPASTGNGREAVRQGVVSQGTQPGSIADPRPAKDADTAANGDRGKSAAQEQQGLTVRQTRALRGDAKQAKWAAVDKAIEEATQWMALARPLVLPVMQGTENLPSKGEVRPLLFVGNHSRMGVYDLPWIVSELYLRGYKARGLAHKGHWQGPLGQFFERFGAVKASPMAAFRLLRQGEAVLLYPGGAKEVNKRKGSEYQLQWRESPDFVRLAAKTNAIIIPFACVGGDDAFELFMDTESILSNSILGPLARSAVGRIDPTLDVREAVLPITKLPGLGIPAILPIPHLERLYFRFMEPVDAAAELPDVNDGDAAAATYGKVRDAVNGGMAALLKHRQTDPLRDLQARLSNTIMANSPAFDLLNGVLPGTALRRNR